MITRNTVKALARLLVGFGTYKIVGQVIDNNIEPPTKLTDKVAIKAGKIAIGGVVATKTEAYTSLFVDTVADAINETRVGFAEIKASLAKES